MSTALAKAVLNSDTPAVTDFLADEKTNLDEVGSDGMTALMHAATAGEAAIGSMLVDSGADVTVCDLQGNTALHMAARNKRRLVASMLLWGQSEIGAANAEGNTPLHEAVCADSRDVAFLIVQRDEAIVSIPNKAGKTPMDLSKDSEMTAVLQGGDP